MRRMLFVVAVVSAVACSKKSEKSETAAKTVTGSATQPAAGGDTPSASAAPSGKESGMQTYTLTPTGGDKPVKVTASIPSSWTVDTSRGADGPSFKVSGIEGGHIVSITAIEPNGGDDAARIAKAIRMQFEEGPNVKREDLSDGRAWVSEIDDRTAHGRVFIPAGDAVVMGIASIRKENESKLPEIRKVLETIKVVQ